VDELNADRVSKVWVAVDQHLEVARDARARAEQIRKNTLRLLARQAEEAAKEMS
jgi:hypothetical protein